MAFQDRFEAGPLLASRLVDLRDSADIVVLTLRGAVPVRLSHGVARVLVVYFPRSKRRTRYLTARLAAQFDAVIHVDQTHAFQPREIISQSERTAWRQKPIRRGVSREQRMDKRKTV